MTIYLSLGSNRGDRAAALRAAIAALPSAGVRVRRVSAFRSTAPVGATGRAWFLNCVVEASTTLLPRVLLCRLRAVELAQGRHRLRSAHARKTPRSIDLDLILYGRARIALPALTVPHPRFAQRGFVLDGLAELAPALQPPGSLTRVCGSRYRVLGSEF